MSGAHTVLAPPMAGQPFLKGGVLLITERVPQPAAYQKIYLEKDAPRDAPRDDMLKCQAFLRG